MEESIVRHSSKKPTDLRVSSLPSSTSTKWFWTQDSQKVGSSKVVKKGWLEKQSRNIFSPWKSRWVVLTESGLSCYENEFENKANSSHTLLLNMDILEVNASANHSEELASNSKNDNNKFIFKIFPVNDNKQSSSSSSSSRKIETYAARSASERKEWLKWLKKVMFAHVGGAIFGTSLSETLQHERRSNADRMVPEVVEMCCKFLLQHGLDVEGLFRLSSRASLIRSLKERFDRGERPCLLFPCDEIENNNKSPSKKTTTSPITTTTSPTTTTTTTPTTTSTATPTTSNIHAVSSLLKAYLLELPEPIIPVSFYEGIMTIVTRLYRLDPEESVKKVAKVLETLPPHNYNLLSYLCTFLKFVGEHQARTKMTHLNLAKVFCNAVLQPEVDDPALLMGTADNRATAVCLLITRVEELFVEKYKTKVEEEEVSWGRGGSRAVGNCESDPTSVRGNAGQEASNDSTLGKVPNLLPAFLSSSKEGGECESDLSGGSCASAVGGEADGGVVGVVRRRRGVGARHNRNAFKHRLSMLLSNKIEGNVKCDISKDTSCYDDEEEDDDDGNEKDGERGDGRDRMMRRSSSLQELFSRDRLLLLSHGSHKHQYAAVDDGGDGNCGGNGGGALVGKEEHDNGDDDDDDDDYEVCRKDCKNGKVIVDNNSLINANRNNIESHNRNNKNNENKSHSTDELLDQALTGSTDDLNSDVTKYPLKHGTSLDLLSASRFSQEISRDLTGSCKDTDGLYPDAVLTDLKKRPAHAISCEMLEQRRDLSEEHKKLISSTLASEHEGMSGSELVNLCHTLKQLLASEHHKVLYLEDKLHQLKHKTPT